MSIYLLDTTLAQNTALRSPDGIIRGAVRQGLDGRRGLLSAGGDEVAAIRHKQVGNVVRPAIGIHNRSARIIPDPASSHEMTAWHVADNVVGLAPGLQGARG